MLCPDAGMGTHSWALSREQQLHPSRELHQSGRGRAGACTGREHTWVVMGNRPEPQAVSICFLPPCFRSEQACALHKRSFGFLEPSCKPHWISSQPRGVTFLVLDVRDGVPNMQLEPLAPQRGSLNLYNPLLFCDPSCCAGSNTIASLPFLPCPCGYFLQPWL